MGKGWIRNTVAGAAMAAVVLGAGAQVAGAALRTEFPTRQTYEISKLPEVYKRPVIVVETMTDRMTAMVNKVRAEGRSCGAKGYFPPAAPLVANGKLTVAAQGHSTDMATNDFHDHVGSNGSEPYERIAAAGYAYTSWAENISAGYTTEQAAIDGWFASPGHCENFMKATLKDIGFGKGTNPNSTYQTYWTANLGRQ